MDNVYRSPIGGSCLAYGGSRFADPPLISRLPSHRWRRRLLLDQRPVQLLEIVAIKEPADHVRRDLLGTDRVKLVSGRELETAICACQRSLETSMEKVAGLNDDHPGSAAVRMAVGQPEELRRFGLLGQAASIGRTAARSNP
jgi:hypothetical protein